MLAELQPQLPAKRVGSTFRCPQPVAARGDITGKLGRGKTLSMVGRAAPLSIYVALCAREMAIRRGLMPLSRLQQRAFVDECRY